MRVLQQLLPDSLKLRTLGVCRHAASGAPLVRLAAGVTVGELAQYVTDHAVRLSNLNSGCSNHGKIVITLQPCSTPYKTRVDLKRNLCELHIPHMDVGQH